MVFALVLRVTLPILVLRLVVLPQQLKDIEVLLLQVDLLLVQAVCHDLRLLSDRLRAPVDFLEDDLHHGRLELGQQVHLVQGLLGLALHLLLGQLTGGPAIEEGRHLDALSYPLGILALLLLDALLDMFWVVALEYVRLALEAVVKFR